MEETLAKPEKIHVKVNGVKVMVVYYSLWDGEEINIKEHQYKGDEADLLEALEEFFTDAKTINL
jgi:ribosomal protein S4